MNLLLTHFSATTSFFASASKSTGGTKRVQVIHSNMCPQCKGAALITLTGEARGTAITNIDTLGGLGQPHGEASGGSKISGDLSVQGGAAVTSDTGTNQLEFDILGFKVKPLTNQTGEKQSPFNVSDTKTLHDDEANLVISSTATLKVTAFTPGTSATAGIDITPTLEIVARCQCPRRPKKASTRLRCYVYGPTNAPQKEKDLYNQYWPTMKHH